MKLQLLWGCLLFTVNAANLGGQKISLEDIERDYLDKTTTISPDSKANVPQVQSPTKFGFVPHRTASSYAATKPKYQYSQTNYQVNKFSYKPQPQKVQQQQYINPQPQYEVPQQYQEYTYIQPGATQQYTIEYQQPSQQYEQYEKVQLLTDNAINQPEGQQTYVQPQYYYVQSPSTAVESVVDPKGVQYVYVPSYTSNSIPVDEKYLQPYVTTQETSLPPVRTTVAKYTTISTGKNTEPVKQYVSQKQAQYTPPAKPEYRTPIQEILVKREPKSLLDSYVPSIVQLQYLSQQQAKSSYSKY
ncbi:hypothetical protein ABEB36_005960 [Hypothenemus hampei]|uniref:Uncharacterized protein n=1 Tax=Hypothenemus hampei TaxID=57062 RepID=A0ABD1F038_HYPHA